MDFLAPWGAMLELFLGGEGVGLRVLRSGIEQCALFMGRGPGGDRRLSFRRRQASLGPLGGTQAGSLILTNGFGFYVEGQREFMASGTGFPLPLRWK